jgi:hypothetical protein
MNQKIGDLGPALWRKQSFNAGLGVWAQSL